MFSTVRGRWLDHKFGEERAVDALAAAAIDVVSVRPLFEPMWQLRANVSGYDAAYLALAESFDCTLATAHGYGDRLQAQVAAVRFSRPRADEPAPIGPTRLALPSPCGGMLP